MKKLLLATAAIFCASALLLQAQDATPKKKAAHKLTAEQKELQKEMLTKYDTNKDGKLDKAEKAAISKEDKAKMKTAGLTGGKKKTPATDAAAPKADAAK
jgi:5-hydroxyisourate hydrolase-like protein (transthyretin family)